MATDSLSFATLISWDLHTRSVMGTPVDSLTVILYAPEGAVPSFKYGEDTHWFVSLSPSSELLA